MATTELNWRIREKAYKEKEAETVIRLDENTVVVANVYFTQNFPENKNAWEVSWQEQKALGHVIKLRVNKMQDKGSVYVGGMGVTVKLDHEPVQRKMSSKLLKVAKELDREYILSLAKNQTTKASRVV